MKAIHFSRQEKLSMFTNATTPVLEFSSEDQIDPKMSIGSALIQNGSAYLEATSIHGLKYLAEKYAVQKLFWLIAFIAGVVLACFLITQVFLQYLASPTYLAFDTQMSQISSIPFPAVTVCNMNRIDKETYDKIKFDSQRSPNDDLVMAKAFALEDLCGVKMTESDRKHQHREGFNVSDFIINAGQRCDDMLVSCLLDGNERRCSDIFQATITDMGGCCSFNILPGVIGNLIFKI